VILLNTIFSMVLGLAVCLAIYMAYGNHKRKQLNNKIAEELDTIILNVIDQVKKVKGASFLAEQGWDSDLISPDMLTTLVTALVNKYGTINLAIEDFTNLKAEEYVSIYVDINSHELILSLDHTLAEDDPLKMINFSNADDNTFH